MELVDSAFDLLARTEIHDDPVTAFDGVDVALLIGAKPRTKGMERADLLGANARDLRQRRPGAQRRRRRRRPGGGGRQPGQHQRPGRGRARARHPRRAVHRADPTRPQPGGRRARTPRAGPRHRGLPGDGVGQSLADPVPGHLPRRRRRPLRRRLRRRHRLADRRFHSHGGKPRHRDHRGPRVEFGGVGGQRRHRSRRRLGRTAPPEATGRRWPCPPPASTASTRAWCARFPCRAVDGAGRSSRDSTSTSSPAPASTPRSAELRSERDAVPRWDCFRRYGCGYVDVGTSGRSPHSTRSNDVAAAQGVRAPSVTVTGSAARASSARSPNRMAGPASERARASPDEARAAAAPGEPRRPRRGCNQCRRPPTRTSATAAADRRAPTRSSRRPIVGDTARAGAGTSTTAAPAPR